MPIARAKLRIRNPILTGFNPDPCICRKGRDYYIATSTFEWFPGVQIHHSRDLVHWRLLTRPLDRVSQLDLRGEDASCGVWAPCLSHADGKFWLVYTDVKGSGPWKETHNYLVAATSVQGPWSEPVYLNSSGFDPSLFHDDDGRKWLVNMVWGGRNTGRNPFAGIVLQEYDCQRNRLTGQPRMIWPGSSLGYTEGPHLYRRDGYYYLLTAEGGTGYDHAVSLARSRQLAGPYELHPENPVLTSKGDPALRLQKAGHGSLVETPSGEWFLAHLCSRPLLPAKRPAVVHEHGCSILGRETALQRVVWGSDGWLRLAQGGRAPRVDVGAPPLPPCPWKPSPAMEPFDKPILPLEFQTLRVPATPDWLSLTERRGWLRLKGRESLHSNFVQAFVGRRVQAFRLQAETVVDFEPENFLQGAGVTAWYNRDTYYYLRVSANDHGEKELGIVVCDRGSYSEPRAMRVKVPRGRLVYLRITWRTARLRFHWSLDGRRWQTIGPWLDATLLADETGPGWRFTGAFLGLCCQDLSGQRRPADFDYFAYREDA